MQTEHLIVNGMSCGGCVSRVTAALTAIPGVGDVKIALPTGKVDVTYDERLTQVAQMNSAIERAGHSVGTTQLDAAPKSKGCRC
jgi:copper chaperone